MYNKVIIIGNLTRDNELKYLPSGSPILNGAIATTHKYKKQSGETVEDVCFLDFSVFGKGGEIMNQYTKKGSKVMIEGRLEFQQWKAQDGTNRSRHTLNVTEFKFLDSKDNNQQQQQQGNYSQPPQQQGYGQPQQNYGQQPQQQYSQQSADYNQPAQNR